MMRCFQNPKYNKSKYDDPRTDRTFEITGPTDFDKDSGIVCHIRWRDSYGAFGDSGHLELNQQDLELLIKNLLGENPTNLYFWLGKEAD